MPLRLEEQYPYYADRIANAREEGFSEDEVFNWIQDRVKEALDEGYDEQEIYDFMGSPQGFQPLSEADLSGADAISGAEQPPPEPIEPYSIIRPDAITEADPGQGPIRTRHQLEPEDEIRFQEWYKKHAKKWGLDPDPDAFEHKYDYRGAYLNGVEPDETGHWASAFKDPDHPNRFVDGVDTITGLTADDFNPDLPGAELRQAEREEENGVINRIKELGELPPEQILPGGLGLIVEEGIKQGKKVLTRKPDEEAARAQNIIGIAKAYDIPIERARKDYDRIIEGLGLKGGPETIPGLAEEMAMKFMLVPIAAGIIANPLTIPSVVLGVGAFMALDEAESYIVQKTQGEDYKALAGRNFSELLPEEANEFARESLDLLSFIAKIQALRMSQGTTAKIRSGTQKLFERFTKEVVTEYGIPRKYTFRPSEVDAVFRRAKDQEVNPQAEAVIKDLMGRKGLSRKEVQEAIDKGLEVEITAEKIVKIADKPYWGKIKSLFGIKPFSREISTTAGGKIEAKIPRRALPPGKGKKGEKPPTQPPSKPPEAPTEEVKPTLEEDLGTLGEKPPEVRLSGKIGKIDTYGRLRRTKTRLTKQIEELPEEKRAPLLEQLETKEKELFEKLTPEERAKFEKKPKGKKKEPIVTEPPKEPEPELTDEEIAQRAIAEVEALDEAPFKEMGRLAGVEFRSFYPTPEGPTVSFHDPESGGDLGLPLKDLTFEGLQAEIKRVREYLPELTEEEKAARKETLGETPIEDLLKPEDPIEKDLLSGTGSLSDRLNSAMDRVDADESLSPQQKKEKKTALQVKYNEIADRAQGITEVPPLTEEQRQRIKEEVSGLQAEFEGLKDRIAKAKRSELAGIFTEIVDAGWDENSRNELEKLIDKRLEETQDDLAEAPFTEGERQDLIKKVLEFRKDIRGKDKERFAEKVTDEDLVKMSEAIDRVKERVDQDIINRLEEIAKGSEKKNLLRQFRRDYERGALPAPKDFKDHPELMEAWGGKEGVIKAYKELDPESPIEEFLEGKDFKAAITGDDPIGKNAEGKQLYEDEKGVRSYYEDNFKVTEPVTILPTGETFVEGRRDEYKTVEELEKEKRDTENPIVVQFTDENNIQLAVRKLKDGQYGVTISDLDAGEGLGTVTKFKDKAAALKMFDSEKEQMIKRQTPREKTAEPLKMNDEDLIEWLKKEKRPTYPSEDLVSLIRYPDQQNAPLALEKIKRYLHENENAYKEYKEKMGEFPELAFLPEQYEVAQMIYNRLTKGPKSDIKEGVKEPKDAESIGQRDTEALGGKPPETGEAVEGEGEGEGVLPEPTGEGGRAGGKPVEEGAEPRPSERGGKGAVLPTKRKGPAKTRGAPQLRPGNNYSITSPTEKESITNVGTEVERYDRNIEAIKLLKELEASGKKATPDQQKVLVRYVGWGGLPKVFDRWGQANWVQRGKELEELLTEEEYDAARRSTPNAHYTSPKVIDIIYDALKQIGFKGGKVLEPSAGIGHFIGMMPPELMGRSKFTGIELDPITGRIAQQLYQGHDIRVSGYEDVRLPNNFYDVAVGNVPFGDYKVYDPEYKGLKVPIHDYFFIKTLDKIKPGGIAALITSRYTLDKQDTKVRKMIADKADLVAAFRLPSSAFKGIANTEVVTDILILRKKVPGEVFKGEDFIKTKETKLKKDEKQGNVQTNEYYHNNPGMILGTESLTGSMYADSTYTVEGILKEEQRTYGKEILGNLISKLPTNVYVEGFAKPPAEPSPDDIIGVKGDVKEGGYKVEGGKIYQREGDNMVKVDFPAGNIVRAKRLIAVKDAVRDLIRVQLQTEEGERRPGDSFERAQKELNRLYDDFVKKHGYVNSKANYPLLQGDPDVPILLAIEKYDPKTGKAFKTPFFTERTIQKYTRPEKADTAGEALLISLNEKGRVDFERMTELTGKNPETLQAELKGQIYKNPDGETWEIADEYLTGDVKSKLEAAREAAKYDEDYITNVEALEKNQPPDVPAEEITTRLGVTWIPEQDYKNFIMEILESQAAEVKVDYVPTGGWIVRARRGRSGTWSSTQYPQSEQSRLKYATKERTTLKLLDAAFNSRNVVIKIRDDDGKVIGTDQVATAENMRIIQELQDLFKEWVLKDQERRSRLSAKYNEEMNRIRPRTSFDGSHLTLPGSNPGIVMRKHQKDGAWRIITSKRNTLLEHEVGAGKTYTIIAAAMESKRLGLVKKPMITAFKHQVPDFQKSIYELYPAARALVPTQKDFTPQNRRKIQAQITTGDWDIIVLSHEQAEKLSMSKKAQRDYIEEQLAEVEFALSDAKEQGLRKSDPTVKQIEKAKLRLMAQLKELMDSPKDTGVTFEELGVDMLLVDEAQKYKNLQYMSTRSRVSGLGNPQGSKRANDLYMKSRYINKLNGGRGIVFTTATPVTNSMVEMYSVLRYLYPEALEQMGVKHFDAWANQFGQDVTSLEVEPTGQGFRMNTRFRRFVNMPELMQVYREVSDIQTQEMLKLPRPQIKGGAQEAVAVESSDAQKEFVDELVKRAEDVRSGGVDPRDDNMLKITTDGRKAAVDMRLVDPTAEDYPDSKLNKAVDKIYEIWKKTEGNKSTQLVFSDLGTPNTKGFNVYADMKSKLVRLGIPKNEIAFIHDATTEAQKQSLFDDVVDGKIRILFGSSEKMGTGMNVQKKLIALHHMDPPWTPALIEQREGRILRQGNENDEVEIFRYATTGTFDAYMWQTLENKQGFLGQVKRGDISRTVEDIDGRALSFAEMKAIASGDPIVRERIETEMRVNELRNLHKAWQRKRWGAEDTIARGPHKIEGYQTEIDMMEKDIALREKNPLVEVDGVKQFEIMVGEQRFADRVEGGEAFIKFYQEQKPIKPDEDSVLAGKYRGFELRLKKFKKLAPRLFLKGDATTYEVGLPWMIDEDVEKADPSGIMTRIENEANRIDTYIQNGKDRIKIIEEEVEAAQKSLEEPFKHEQELREKEKKMDELLEELEPGDEEVGDTEGILERKRQIGEEKLEGEEELAYDPERGIFRTRLQEPSGEMVWKAVRGEKVELKEGYDFFAYKDAESETWHVIEQSTGLAITGRGIYSKAEAVKQANNNLAKAGDENFRRAVEAKLEEIKQEEGRLEEPLSNYSLLKEDAKTAFGGEKRQARVIENMAKQLDLFEKETGIRGLTESVKAYKGSLADTLRKNKSVDLRGYRLTKGDEAREIAELFQIYRNPKMEIMHEIYTDKEGKVLAHTAVTSGAVNYVRFKDTLRNIQETKRRMKRLGANKVHFLHNHPSGTSWMSESDKQMGSYMKLHLKGKMGEYVVIDHGTFAYLTKINVKRSPGVFPNFSYNVEQDQKPFQLKRGAGMWMVSKKKSPALIGPDVVAGFAKDLMKKNRTVVAFIDSQNQVQGWASVSDYTFLMKPNWKEIIRDYTKAHDATSAILVTGSKEVRNLGNAPVGDVLTEILYDRGEDVSPGERFESVRRSEPQRFDDTRKWIHEQKTARRLFEEQAPYGEDLTPEQAEALARAEEQVAKMMHDARQRGIRFGRKYLKSLGYTPKQITQILKVKRFMQNKQQKLGTPRENAVNVLEMHLRSAERLKSLKKTNYPRLYRTLKRGVVDVSGNIKPRMLKAGEPGKVAVIRHDLSAGATPWAQRQFEEATDRIYGKGEWGKELSRQNEEILNMVINSRRIVTIDNYKEGMKHPEGYTGDHHADYLDYENFKHAFKNAKTPDGKPLDMDISEDFYRELIERSNLWFDEMNRMLKKLYDKGLISEASYDAMVEIGEYAPRFFIQHIDPDKSYTFGGGKTITVSSSGIKKLESGSYETLELDSRLLLYQVIARTENRIAKNDANLALWELAEQVPENGLVRKAVIQSYTPKGVPNFEKTPARHEEIDVMIDGQRRRMFMPDEWAREWVMRDPSIDQGVANWIGWLSGANLLRPMATGMFAPEFFITNLARDAAHLWVVTDTFSSFLPYAMAQYGKAIKAVYKDALAKTGLYELYIKYGGGMNFLTKQGHFTPTKYSKTLEKFEKIGSYLGESSEILNRLALMQMEMWKAGVDKMEEGSPEWERAVQEAVWVARNYIDFYQGGSWAKMLDTGVPYLNAGIQGTRGIARAVNQDWKKTTWKISQLMMLATGLYLANYLINKETLDNISESDQIRYWCITMPGKITDSKGNKRGWYFIVAKDQGQRFFAQIAEQSMRAMMGEPVMWNNLQEGFKDMIPVIPTQMLPPTIDAIYGYANNKDFWLQKEIWRDKFNPVGRIEPRLEYTDYTHPALVEFGDVTNTSPERLKYILEQFFTYGNVFTSIVGGATRMMMRKLPGNEGDKVLEEILARQPGIRKLVRLTRETPDIERREANDALRRIYSRRFEQRRKVMNLSEEYYAQEKQKMPEAEQTAKLLNSYIAEQPEGDRKRLTEMFEDYPLYDDIPDRGWWLSLRGMPAEAKAYVYFSKWVRANPEKREQLESMRSYMPGMKSDAFVEEFSKLYEKSKELSK